MKTLVTNKKALFNYEQLATYDAGIVLEGWEVKSVKAGNVSLKESYITIRDSEAWLVGAHIAKWRGMANPDAGVETRDRKLLLHRSELDALMRGKNERGSTIVPVNMHTERNIVKLKLALARGKKLYDKRQALKEKETKRTIERDIKQFNLR
ncbi:MAG: SsrA-binding protein [candidate division WS6 bacterium OLB20]|uniref:SsrA-binding protein n=1 Tax=candidate division WS6 bacterium OLB20 TaxID=1617426 RepID=A0A136LYQ0_9BACT|nr:MAG: SsrA-binding protein [candidate division WS6 bacterium OLB20]